MSFEFYQVPSPQPVGQPVEAIVIWVVVSFSNVSYPYNNCRKTGTFAIKDQQKAKLLIIFGKKHSCLFVPARMLALLYNVAMLIPLNLIRCARYSSIPSIVQAHMTS